MVGRPSEILENSAKGHFKKLEAPWKHNIKKCGSTCNRHIAI